MSDSAPKTPRNFRRELVLHLPDDAAMREVLHYISECIAQDESEYHSEDRPKLAEAWALLGATLEQACEPQ